MILGKGISVKGFEIGVAYFFTVLFWSVRSPVQSRTSPLTKASAMKGQTGFR